jgi:hypothetical protein
VACAIGQCVDVVCARALAQSTMCATYTCDTVKGCLIQYTCAAGCAGVCKIGGQVCCVHVGRTLTRAQSAQCYVRGALNPTNACQYCEPTQSQTAWHTCGTDPVVSVTGDQCASESCTAGVCVTGTLCLPQCQVNSLHWHSMCV